MTYNEIIKEFQSFANSHLQIQSYGNGDLWEVVEHDQEEHFKYPLLWSKPEPNVMGQGTDTFVFKILCVDLVHKDESNEDDVLSDTNLILKDLVAHIEQLYTGDWKFIQIEKNITITPFTERFSDEVAGWWMDIRLKQPFKYDSCSIPT